MAGGKNTTNMETVQLKIKSPSAAISDLVMEARVEDTVLDIKKKIAEAYPTKPSPQQQKLVYSGKMLNDVSRLEDVLRFEDECSVFTFHLVCAMPRRRSDASPDGLRYRPAPSSLPPLDQVAVPPPASYTAPTTTTTPTTNMEEMMRSFSTQYTAAMTTMPSSPSEAELAAMQELYSQYLGLYMQYLGQDQATAQYQHLLPQQPALQQVQAREEVAGGQEAGAPVPGPNAGMVMNAGGGGAVAAEAAGDRNRDILDWVYVMTRVMLLFSVIYFHSSFLRLAFVVGLGFLVYLYQGRVRAQRVPVPPTPAPEPQQEVHPEAEVEEDGEDGDVAVEQPKPSLLAMMVTFLTTLVSSIVPEHNQVV